MLLPINAFTAAGASRVSPRRVLAAASDAAATAGETCSVLPGDEITPTHGRHDSRGEGPWT